MAWWLTIGCALVCVQKLNQVWSGNFVSSDPDLAECSLPLNQALQAVVSTAPQICDTVIGYRYRYVRVLGFSQIPYR